MRGRPVAVTGIGVISVCGIGREDFWAGLFRPAPPAIQRRVPEFDPGRWLDRRTSRHLDRFGQFALAAASLALDDAGLAGSYDGDRAGVSLGTGIGGIATLEEQILVRETRGPGRVSPYTIPMSMPNSGAATISLHLGLRGPSETIATACAAGTHAIAAGARLVADERCDLVLAGGAESCLTPTNLAAFTVMGALTRSGVSRPFDLARDGFAAAEGAAVLTLEPLDAARARGAAVYAVLAGAASTSDAFHVTAPAPRGAGALRCMQLALADAGLAPRDVVHVNAHGTSTPHNDLAESQAIATLLSGRAVPVTSIKGVLGHSLGAAGALEAAAAALTLRTGTVPPTAGTTEVDPAVEVEVAREPLQIVPGPVLSNSFGFGGHNGCLVLIPPPG
ncbi:MAG: beta-ketoacyl-[acyl-carrier-protein] synthase family protein [Mycobacteriales bacterium]